MARSQAGFTLLEVLVAFAIAALALSLLFRATIESEAGTTVAARTQEALSRARSRLAVIDATPALAASDQQGDDGGGFRWRVRIAPLLTTPPNPAPNAAPPAQLLAVTVAVSWQQGSRTRAVQLETRRLGLAPPPAP